MGDNERAAKQRELLAQQRELEAFIAQINSVKHLLRDTLQETVKQRAESSKQQAESSSMMTYGKVEQNVTDAVRSSCGVVRDVVVQLLIPSSRFTCFLYLRNVPQANKQHPKMLAFVSKKVPNWSGVSKDRGAFKVKRLPEELRESARELLESLADGWLGSDKADNKAVSAPRGQRPALPQHSGRSGASQGGAGAGRAGARSAQEASAPKRQRDVQEQRPCVCAGCEVAYYTLYYQLKDVERKSALLEQELDNQRQLVKVYKDQLKAIWRSRKGRKQEGRAKDHDNQPDDEQAGGNNLLLLLIAATAGELEGGSSQGARREGGAPATACAAQGAGLKRGGTKPQRQAPGEQEVGEAGPPPAKRARLAAAALIDVA